MDKIAIGLFMIKFSSNKWSKGNKAYDKWNAMTRSQKDKDAAKVKKEVTKKCFFTPSGQERCR